MTHVWRRDGADHFDALVILIATGFYGVILYLLVGNSTSETYGVESPAGAFSALKVVNQYCLIFVAVAAFLLAPLVHNQIDAMLGAKGNRTPATILAFAPVSLGLAGIFGLASWIAIRFAVPAISGLAGGMSLDVWTGFFIDSALVFVFSLFVHSFVRRWWLTVALFISYVAILLFYASRGGNLAFLGFGTTSQLFVTGHASHAIGREVAWLTRGYWILITIAMLGLLGVFCKPQSSNTRNRVWRYAAAILAAIAAVSAVFVAVYVQEHRKLVMSHFRGTDQAVEMLARSATFRPTATHARIVVVAQLNLRKISVSGVVDLKNVTDHSINTLVFVHAPTLRIKHVRLTGKATAPPVVGTHSFALQLQTPLSEGESVKVAYQGVIDASDPFDEPSRGIVLDEAFFLDSSNLLPLPRSGRCMSVQMSLQCGSDENYQLSDPFPVSVTVDAPTKLVVVGGRRHSTAGLRSLWLVDFPAQALGNVLIGASRFRTVQCVKECTNSGAFAYLAPYSLSDPGIVQHYADQELNAFATAWQRPPVNRYWVAEMPGSWRDAISYLGGAAVNERLFDQNYQNRSLSTPAKMVMSHEIAHQWWGYGLVPFKRPGSPFILESFAQFAALRRMQDQGLLTRAFVYRTTQNLSSKGLASTSGRRLPLRALAASDWQAYYEGPLVLMRADALAKGRLMTELGEIQHKLGRAGGQPVDPSQVIAALTATLPRSIWIEFDGVRTRK